MRQIIQEKARFLEELLQWGGGDDAWAKNYLRMMFPCSFATERRESIPVAFASGHDHVQCDGGIVVRSRYLGGLYMASAASIWGGMYVVSKVVLTTVQPLALVWVRYVVALVALALASLATKQSWVIRWRDVPLVMGIGVIGYTGSIWAQFLGTKLSTAQMGAMITSATPAFMVLFGRIILHEKITARRAVSVGIATIGVIFIIGFGTANRFDELGGLILTAAALSWALMSVLVKRVPHDYSQLTVTLYAILTATVVITPRAITQVIHIPLEIWLYPRIWIGVLYLGLVSTAGAFFLWNKGLQWVEASSGGLYFFFQPLVGTILGWAVLGEMINWAFGLGALLVLGGVVLVLRES